MRYFALVLYGVVVAIHIFACASRDRLKLRRVSKCFLMPLLALSYAAFARVFSPLVLTAILFGFVGDVLLLARPRRWAFPAGMLAFATGHVFYIVSMLSELPNLPPWYVFAAFALFCAVAACLFVRYLWAGLPKKLRAPSIVYMMIIGFMACCALLFGFSGVSRLCWLAAVGGVLFVASDATLSIDAFKHPVKHRSVIVMGTYIAAQTLLVTALALR
ncbi:MAG: lysoplasmalogenase [Clostridiaceae bacterium]